ACFRNLTNSDRLQYGERPSDLCPNNVPGEAESTAAQHLRMMKANTPCVSFVIGDIKPKTYIDTPFHPSHDDNDYDNKPQTLLK
ncbi:hypothetical protein STEG23_020330, partial [Scotinomys teguina]